MPATTMNRDRKTGHNCEVCRSRHRKRIETMLVTGVPLRDIETNYGYSRTMLSRHRSAMGQGMVSASEVKRNVSQKLESQTLDLGRMIADIHQIHFGAVMELDQMAQAADGRDRERLMVAVAKTSEGALRAAQGSAGLRIMERYLESTQPERVDPEDVTLGKLLAYAMEPGDTFDGEVVD